MFQRFLRPLFIPCFFEGLSVFRDVVQRRLSRVILHVYVGLRSEKRAQHTCFTAVPAVV